MKKIDLKNKGNLLEILIEEQIRFALEINDCLEAEYNRLKTLHALSMELDRENNT